MAIPSCSGGVASLTVCCFPPCCCAWPTWPRKSCCPILCPWQVFKLVIPVLLSLLVIRLGVKVLQAAFK
jgi:hypothetical protein